MEFYFSKVSKKRNSISIGLILSLQIIAVFVQLIALTSAASSVDDDLILTLSQKQTLDKFKERVSGKLPHDYMKQDIYLIRWLRAKNFNIEQADTMLSENLKWRKANKMDSILQEDWSEFTDKYPYYLETVTKDGKPILAGNFGDWDIRAVSLAGRLPLLIRYLDRGMEDGVTAVRKLQDQGKNVTQFAFLVNMDNYNIIQHGCLQCASFYLALINSYQNHYPGFASNIILINTPPVFEVILRLLRPLANPITRKAFKVYGQDKAQWSKRLLELADKSQLPVEYGGTYKKLE